MASGLIDVPFGGMHMLIGSEHANLLITLIGLHYCAMISTCLGLNGNNSL